MNRLIWTLILPWILGCQPSSKQQNIPEVQSESDSFSETREEFDQRMDWWRDDTFGMFIHWGVYAVPGGVHKGEQIPSVGEWIMNTAEIPIPEYEEYARRFNPIEYDAEEWVSIAKAAGMRYIVITSKHHDGFCLWDSEVSEYDVMDFAPIKRDLLMELKEACQKEGVKLCFYHSIMDWHHPDAQGPHYPTYNTKDKSNPNFDSYYETYLKPQVAELVTKYDPWVMWFDGEWIPEYTHQQGMEMYQFVRKMKPEIIINNRVDKGRKGMQGMNADDQEYAGDFGTPEQEILEGTSNFDWESCMTMNDSWGWKSWDENWKSAETLIHNLVDVTAKGGNYLLNVGPTPEGRIPEPNVQRLNEIGAWLKVNGEAIYGTVRWKEYAQGEGIYFTQKKDGDDLYVICTQWPGNSLVISDVRPETGSAIELLGSSQEISWTQGGSQLELDIPEELQSPEARPCKYAWCFRITI